MFQYCTVSVYIFVVQITFFKNKIKLRLVYYYFYSFEGSLLLFCFISLFVNLLIQRHNKDIIKKSNIDISLIG